MEFRYLGFNQRGNSRAYQFDCVAKGEATRQFTVTADMALFLAHRVAIQEGPTLCARKLAADLEACSATPHELTAGDLHTYCSNKAQAEAAKAEARKHTPRRSPEATAYAGSPWRGTRQ